MVREGPRFGKLVQGPRYRSLWEGGTTLPSQGQISAKLSI